MGENIQMKNHWKNHAVIRGRKYFYSSVFSEYCYYSYRAFACASSTKSSLSGVDLSMREAASMNAQHPR